MVNKNAVIKKCAVYLEKYGSTYKRTIACKGRNITYAYYVPYLARNGKTQYDGNTHYSIRTFALRPDSHGVWSYNGNYTLITANLEDANGRMLAVQSTGVAGRNTRIFYDKAKMMKWLNTERKQNQAGGFSIGRKRYFASGDTVFWHILFRKNKNSAIPAPAKSIHFVIPE